MLFRLSPDMDLQTGFSLFLATIPIGLVGLFSAISQGKVVVSGINILAKKRRAHD